jgi:branched-chain amino acid transport system substrate-binding protein
MPIVCQPDRRSVLQGIATVLTISVLALSPQLGLADSRQGVTDNEILIGGLGQLTGPFAFIGGPGRDGMQLAIDEINKVGPINGRKLKLLFENAGTPAEAVAAAKKLNENDKAFILVIATGSTGAAAAADYVRSAGVPTYNLFGATPIIRNPFARNVFHGSMPPAEISGAGLIEEVFKAVPGAKKVGILAGSYPFPQSNLKAIQPLLEKRGVEVAVEQFDAAASDYTAQLISFARHRVPVIMILGSFTEAGFAIKQAPEKGLTDVAWVVDGSATNDAIVPIIGKENTSKITGYYNAPYFPTQTDEPMKNFIRIWTAKYSNPPQGRPNLYDIVGYGCTYVMAQAIKSAGRDLSWDSLIASWEKLKDANPSDMGGYDVTFPETVTSTDHQGNKLIGPSRIVDGKWKVVR